MDAVGARAQSRVKVDHAGSDKRLVIGSTGPVGEIELGKSRGSVRASEA